MPDNERHSFIKAFEALPTGLQAGMIAEVMNNSSITPEWIDDAHLQRALAAKDGAIVREWGHEAKQKLGKVRTRLWRMIDTHAGRPRQCANHSSHEQVTAMPNQTGLCCRVTKRL